MRYFNHAAFLEDKKVRPLLHPSSNHYDGSKLDELVINASLNCQQDFDDLIKFLQIHKFCFENSIQ